MHLLPHTAWLWPLQKPEVLALGWGGVAQPLASAVSEPQTVGGTFGTADVFLTHPPRGACDLG